MEPGIYYDMPDAEYRKLDALNASVLKLGRRSPLHIWQALTQPSQPTARMQLGSALHCAVLEPEQYDTQVAVGPARDRRTKAWQEWARDCDAPIKLVQPEADLVAHMRDAVCEHAIARDLLEVPGRNEVTAVWQDPNTAAWCKARADRLCRYEDALVLVELKTAADASPQGFRQAIRRYGYDLSAAWYRLGFALAGKEAPASVVFVVVENEPPYGVATYRLPGATLDNAEAEIQSYLRRFVECRDSGRWPSYPELIMELTL